MGKRKPFIKISTLRNVFNDLLLILTHKQTLFVKPHHIMYFTYNPTHAQMLGKLLKYLSQAGLAKRVNTSKKHKRYRLVPTYTWRRFVEVCGPRPPNQRYKCSNCPLAPQCPFILAIKEVVRA